MRRCQRIHLRVQRSRCFGNVGLVILRSLATRALVTVAALAEGVLLATLDLQINDRKTGKTKSPEMVHKAGLGLVSNC